MEARSQDHDMRSWTGRNGFVHELVDPKTTNTKRKLDGWVVVHEREDGTLDIIEPTFSTREKLSKDYLCRYAKLMSWGEENWQYWMSQRYSLTKATLTVETIQ